MKYTVRECGKGSVVAGLENVSPNNGNLVLLAPDKPISSLKVGEFTYGRNRGQVYEIVRSE